MKKLLFLVLAIAALMPVNVKAQDVAGPNTLFPYPVAPDTIKTFENRVSYIVARFWNNYDLSKPIADLDAFNGAFRDYLDFVRYGHRTVAVASVRDFLFKAQSNNANFEKIARLAEQNLYQVGAVYWSDEIYAEFLKAIIKNKGLRSDVRNYYSKQLSKINRTSVGTSLADLSYVNLDGNKVKLGEIEAEMMFVYLSKDEDSDHSFERVRLSIDVAINNLLTSGKVKLLCLNPAKYSDAWAANAVKYSDNWIVGCCQDMAVDGEYDIRFLPSFILLDKDKKIIQKNVGIEAIKSSFGY